MRELRVVFFVACVFGVLAGATAAEAQCAPECLPVCPNMQKVQGMGEAGVGTVLAACRVGGCEACVPDPLVGDSLPATELLQTIGAAPLGELEIIVEQYRARLVLNRDRDLIAVLDAACDGTDAISAVLVVSPERAEVINRLGVKGLAEFLAESGTGS